MFHILHTIHQFLAANYSEYCNCNDCWAWMCGHSLQPKAEKWREHYANTPKMTPYHSTADFHSLNEHHYATYVNAQHRIYLYYAHLVHVQA